MVAPLAACRPYLIIALLATLVGCGGGNGGAPSPLVPGAQGQLPAAANGSQSGVGALGVYDLHLNFRGGEVELTPVGATRDPQAIGDLLDLDITPFLNGSPCGDCFKVAAMGLDPDGNLMVDFALRHPYPDSSKRRDLDIFDARAIVIAPGTSLFAESPQVHADNDGVGDLEVSGNIGLLLNADGYTSHFDSKVTDPQYFNPPLSIPGSINPYIQFFTENDPTATGTGFPLPNHRFAMTPTVDHQRFLFELPPDGSSELRVVIVIEAQYGVSATMQLTRDDPTQLGARMNPVYFLPAFNQQEAYKLEVELDDFFTEGDPPDRTLTGAVLVEDWQAGLIGDLAYGDLSRTMLIPATSDVAAVTSEIPGLQNSAKALPLESGTGKFGDPYRYTLEITNDLGAGIGTYAGLISVVDSLDGLGGRPTALPGDAIYSFVTYKPFTVDVRAFGGNRPPMAAASADPNPVESGQQVLLSDDDSSDPDVGDSITKYEWDYDISDGRAYTDSISALPNQASMTPVNSGTEPITITASLRVTDTGDLTNAVDIDIIVNPPISGNNPPVAIPEVEQSTVPSGTTVLLKDSSSFDPDLGDSIGEYAWDLDVADGRDYLDIVSGTPDQAATVFTNPGTASIDITISLRVQDSFGAYGFEDLVITVLPAGGGNNPPVAVPETLQSDFDPGETVRFLDFHSYDPDPGDSVVEYAWDFDVADGRTYDDSVSAIPNIAESTYANPTPDPIVITVSLQVKDEQGAIGTEDMDITINAGAGTCTDPLAKPSLLRVPTLPEAPYTVNFLTFEWNAPSDPNTCLLGYAVYRSARTGPDNTAILLSDLDDDNVLDANEVITTTTFADSTLAEDGATLSQYYRYTVRSVSNGPDDELLQSIDSNPVFVYINDFETMEQLSGGTWRGTRSGFSWGRINALAYPDLTAFLYGFEIATDDGNAGSSYCLDESADIAAGGYGPTNHDPYAAASNFDDFIDDGYWNSFGPQLFTDLEDNLLPTGGPFRKMQLYHKYQMETYFDPNQGVDVAADMGYIAVMSHADWEANKFNRLIDLPVLEGKDYDSAAPGYNPFMDQQLWGDPGQFRPDQQIPAMNFIGGDARIDAGAPDWVKTVYDLTAIRNMTQPVVQFAVAADEWAQQPDHIGWSIDDILVVCY